MKLVHCQTGRTEELKLIVEKYRETGLVATTNTKISPAQSVLQILIIHTPVSVQSLGFSLILYQF